MFDFVVRLNRLNSCRQVQKEACCEGWTGASCTDPICKIACVNGKCVAPDTCSCEPGYAGEACQFSQSMFNE